MKPWEKYQKADGPWSKYSKPKEREVFDPTEGMGTGEKILAGIGSGMVGAGRTAANLLLPESLTPKWASKEAIEEQREIDAPLLSTGAGLTGNIIGATALTAPVGGAVGAGAKALAAGSRVARAAPVLSRALGSTPGIAAVEGGTQGALLSDPDNRLSSVALGAGLGGGLSLAAKGIGKVGGSWGTERTASAEKLEKLMKRFADQESDAFIPLPQASEPGLWKQIYEGIVANIPGAGQKLRGQYDRVLATFNETALARSLPPKVNIGTIFKHGDDLMLGFKNAQRSWDEAFDVFNKMEFSAKGFKIPQYVNDIIGDFKFTPNKSGMVTGQQIVDLKRVVQGAVDQMDSGPANRALKNKFIGFRDNLENGLVRDIRRLTTKGKVPHGTARYRQLIGKNFNNWRKLRAAMEASGGASSISPTTLRRVATRMSGKAGIEGGGGRMQELGKLGSESLKPFPSKQGIFQTVAALGLMGGATGAGAVVSDNPIIGGAAGLGALIAAGRGMASPAVQRFLMRKAGPRASALAKALRSGGRTARRALITEAVRQNNEQK